MPPGISRESRDTFIRIGEPYFFLSLCFPFPFPLSLFLLFFLAGGGEEQPGPYPQRPPVSVPDFFYLTP